MVIFCPCCHAFGCEGRLQQCQVTGCIIVFTFVIGNQKLEHDQVKNKGQVDRAHESIIDTKCAHRKVNALT